METQLTKFAFQSIPFIIYLCDSDKLLYFAITEFKFVFIF